MNSNGPVTFNPVRFNSLKVNLRLGDQASSPMDTEGPVQVSLANGNAVIRTASPTLKTVGGDVDLAYTYSSKAPSPYGLKAEYFNACNGSTPSPFSTQPILVRTDSAVSFNWGTGSPAPGIVGTDDFCVRWTGLITTPRTNTYCFGATRDDGVRIYVNDILVLDSWIDQATAWDAGGMNCLPLLTSRTNSLRVEYYEHGGGAQIDLWASGAFSPLPVPSSWLSMVPPAVPSGWSLSANTSAGLAYTEARVSGDSIVLVEPSGATHEYKKTARCQRCGGDHLEGIVRGHRCSHRPGRSRTRKRRRRRGLNSSRSACPVADNHEEQPLLERSIRGELQGRWSQSGAARATAVVGQVDGGDDVRIAAG